MVHAIEVKNIYKEFRKVGSSLSRQIPKSDSSGYKPVVVAVDHVSFEVKEGEIFGVLGPDGSGKTTLMRLIATLLLPDKGDIQVFGYNAVREPMEIQRLINRVPVKASFFKRLSPMKNLLYCASLYGKNGMGTRIQVEETLLHLGMEQDSIYRPMDELSCSMQQRVAIARALLSQPRLLLMDEPTRGLDPLSKGEVQEVIRYLNRESGTTILLTTKDTDVADNLCDRIAIIDNGKIAALDTPQGLKQNISPNGQEPTLADVFSEVTEKTLMKQESG